MGVSVWGLGLRAFWFQGIGFQVEGLGFADLCGFVEAGHWRLLDAGSTFRLSLPKREKLTTYGLSPERQAQVLVLTVLYVPSSLDSAWRFAPGLSFWFHGPLTKELANIRQSGPASGPGFQVNQMKPLMFRSVAVTVQG